VVKKQPTVKWLLVCDQFRRILFVSRVYDGHVHAFTIVKETFTGFDFSLFRLHVDSGFSGLEHYVTPCFLFRPTKARKGHPLTVSQRACNTPLASVRVRVEHTIAKAKAFFSLRIENRLKQKKKLDDAMAICAGLANFKTQFSTS